MNKLKKSYELTTNPLVFPRHRFSSTHTGYHQKLESSCSCTCHIIVANRCGWISPSRCSPYGLGASFLPIWDLHSIGAQPPSYLASAR